MSILATTPAQARWPVAHLGDLCDVNIGRTPARERRDFWGPGSPWLSITDMNQGRDLKYTAETITDLAVKECNCRLVSEGTVLLSFKLSIGKVGITKRALFTNEAIAALPVRDPSRLCPDFLYWALRSIDLTPGLDRAAKGLTLNRDKLLRLRIPLPSLADQRRIAEILDKADGLRAKRRSGLAQLDTLTQSIFLDTFGEPATNPKGWAMAALRELGRVATGRTPPSAKEGMFEGTIPFVTPGDLESDQPVRRTVTEEGAAESSVVSAESTLVCCIGATIGKMGKATTRSAFNQQINAVEWGANVDAAYGLTAMRFFKPTIIAWGSSTTLPILKKSAFERIQIPVPPLDLQKAFARRIGYLEDLRKVSRRSLTALNELFSALQAQAFNQGL